MKVTGTKNILRGWTVAVFINERARVYAAWYWNYLVKILTSHQGYLYGTRLKVSRLLLLEYEKWI
jgi:hypothetical protein